jgi:hypothetical protein
MLAFDELDLEGGDERLGDGVIQARPNAAHGTPQSQLGHRRPPRQLS